MGSIGQGIDSAATALPQGHIAGWRMPATVPRGVEIWWRVPFQEFLGSVRYDVYL
jgi:hypothetical protein